MMEAIVKDPFISARKLAEVISISHRKTQENFAKLKRLGFIKRVGPAKGGHWEGIDNKDANE